ncbi:MAG TPA: type III pantothenate kinase [Oscillospiraceae bacterium]|nr:type III pantothenate kinase [Oscillospiraceae bacterium]
MLLAIDIGNSHITLGGYEGETLRFMAHLVTETRRTDDQYAIELKDIMMLYELNANEIDGVIICSVVPEFCATLKSAVYKVTGIKPMVLGPGIKTGLNILIDNPAQLGADLVAGAVSAISKFPLPCIIFDLGTATTISVIDKNGNFIGGMICAGVGITLEALTTRTALLPHVSIEKPAAMIGKNSIDSMQSGLIIGTAAMLDGMCDRIEKELGAPASLVATGGLAPVVVPNCNRDITLCENLLLDGLKIIYNKNKKNFKG